MPCHPRPCDLNHASTSGLRRNDTCAFTLGMTKGLALAQNSALSAMLGRSSSCTMSSSFMASYAFFSAAVRLRSTISRLTTLASPCFFPRCLFTLVCLSERNYPDYCAPFPPREIEVQRDGQKTLKKDGQTGPRQRQTPAREKPCGQASGLGMEPEALIILLQ